jgi:hypothetical protein
LLLAQPLEKRIAAAPTAAGKTKDSSQGANQYSKSIRYASQEFASRGTVQPERAAVIQLC